MLTARCSGHLLPKPRAGEGHLGETVVRGVATLHSDIDATAGRRGFVGIEDDVGRKNEIDGGKCGAANGQVVKNIFVHEIRDVSNHRLRMNVV